MAMFASHNLSVRFCPSWPINGTTTATATNSVIRWQEMVLLLGSSLSFSKHFISTLKQFCYEYHSYDGPTEQPTWPLLIMRACVYTFYNQGSFNFAKAENEASATLLRFSTGNGSFTRAARSTWGGHTLKSSWSERLKVQSEFCAAMPMRWQSTALKLVQGLTPWTSLWNTSRWMHCVIGVDFWRESILGDFDIS